MDHLEPFKFRLGAESRSGEFTLAVTVLASLFKQKGVARFKNDQDMLLPFNYLPPPFLLTPHPPIPSPFFMLALLP